MKNWKMRCVDRGYNDFYTSGKIYEVVNNMFETDDGHWFNNLSGKLEDFESWKTWSGSKWELIEEDGSRALTKSDLESSMVVQTNEGTYLVVGDKLMNENGFMRLSSYEDNLLLCKNRRDGAKDEFDIIKVYSKVHNFNQIKDCSKLELIWERKDEDEISNRKSYPFFNDSLDGHERFWIKPSVKDGYSASLSNGCPLTIFDNVNQAFIPLSIQNAKDMIIVLNEIIDFVEDKNLLEENDE